MVTTQVNKYIKTQVQIKQNRGDIFYAMYEYFPTTYGQKRTPLHAICAKNLYTWGGNLCVDITCTIILSL